MCKHSKDSIITLARHHGIFVLSQKQNVKAHETSFVVPTWRTKGCTATVQHPRSLQNTTETYANQAASLGRLGFFSDNPGTNFFNIEKVLKNSSKDSQSRIIALEHSTSATGPAVRQKRREDYRNLGHLRNLIPVLRRDGPPRSQNQHPKFNHVQSTMLRSLTNSPTQRV